jgi:hypothetical protein
MSYAVELSHTVATLERTLAADEALTEAMALDPRLDARAAKLRRRAHGLLCELGGLLASSPIPARPGRLGDGVESRDLRHLTARLASYEHRMSALTYDASLVDLGAAG